MKKYILLICLIINFPLFIETAPKAYAGDLRIENQSSSVTGSFMNSKHIEGASDGYDAYDASYMSGNPNKLHIYSCINDPYWPEHDKLKLDARGANSTTTYNIELYNNKFSGSVDNYLRFQIINKTNFEWKNMFFNINGDKFDINYLIINGEFDPFFQRNVGKIYLDSLSGSQAGVYNTGDLDFFNHADLDRDRKVNNIDYSIFAKNWGRTGIVKGSDVNDLGAYADLTDAYDVNGVMTSYGDGVVDFNDLGEFVGEWLWDANDPNTW